MKAALLSSLAYRPKLVVLDEPFSGLDALVRDEFLHGLLELTETEDWTVLLSSHDIDEVERLADRVAILNGGHLAVDESTEHLQERFRQMEIHLGSEETPLPKAPPKTWLNVEKTGRVVRFIETGHVAAGEDDVLKAQFPGMERFHSEPMKLREIFVTLAKTYRLS